MWSSKHPQDTTVSSPRRDLRERFVDLLMAFEASPVKPLCWAHMMVLRHKSSGCASHGLSAAGSLPPIAQKWENDHNGDRAAWAHSVMVAAAKGRQQSVPSLFLDVSKFYEHVGHDHLWDEGIRTGFPRRLLACWCASYEGWRFLEADKCATCSFWPLGPILPGCSGATTAAKLMRATLLESVANRLPSFKLWNVVDDISGHVAGSPRLVQATAGEAARLLVEGLAVRHLPL